MCREGGAQRGRHVVGKATLWRLPTPQSPQLLHARPRSRSCQPVPACNTESHTESSRGHTGSRQDAGCAQCAGCAQGAVLRPCLPRRHFETLLPCLQDFLCWNPCLTSCLITFYACPPCFLNANLDACCFTCLPSTYRGV